MGCTISGPALSQTESPEVCNQRARRALDALIAQHAKSAPSTPSARSMWTPVAVKVSADGSTIARWPATRLGRAAPPTTAASRQAGAGGPGSQPASARKKANAVHPSASPSASPKVSATGVLVEDSGQYTAPVTPVAPADLEEAPSADDKSAPSSPPADGPPGASITTTLDQHALSSASSSSSTRAVTLVYSGGVSYCSFSGKGVESDKLPSRTIRQLPPGDLVQQSSTGKQGYRSLTRSSVARANDTNERDCPWERVLHQALLTPKKQSGLTSTGGDRSPNAARSMPTEDLAVTPRGPFSAAAFNGTALKLLRSSSRSSTPFEFPASGMAASPSSMVHHGGGELESPPLGRQPRHMPIPSMWDLNTAPLANRPSNLPSPQAQAARTPNPASATRQLPRAISLRAINQQQASTPTSQLILPPLVSSSTGGAAAAAERSHSSHQGRTPTTDNSTNASASPGDATPNLPTLDGSPS